MAIAHMLLELIVEVYRYSNDSNTFLMVTLVAAPCVTNSKTDCDDCSVDYDYDYYSHCYAYTGLCNCDTDCYEICSDMSVYSNKAMLW